MGLKRKPPEGNVRRVVSTGQNLPGTITNKEGRTIQVESFQERILTLVLERDKSVRDYGSQPETFVFPDLEEKDKSRKYTPDFIVWRRDGTTEIHEVTLTKRQERLNIREREAAAQKICQERGWSYIVHTEKTLPQRTEVTNLLALLRYRLKTYEQVDVTSTVRKYLSGNVTVPLSVCMKYVSQQVDLTEPIVFASFCHLLWHEHLCTDLQTLLIVECEFAKNAMVWLPRGEEE